MLEFKKEYFQTETNRHLYPTILDLSKAEVYGCKDREAFMYKIPNDRYTSNAGNIDFSLYPNGVWSDYTGIKIVERLPFFQPSINFNKLGDITPSNLNKLKEEIKKHIVDLETAITESVNFIDSGVPGQNNLPYLPEGCVWFRDPIIKDVIALPISELYEKFGKLIKELEKVLDEYIEQKKEEIRGPAGAIDNITASVNSNVGTPKVTVSLSGTPERRKIDLKFENLKGDKPIKGEDYLTPAEKEQFTNDTKAIVQAEGNKVIEQVKSIVAGNPATTNALTLSGKTRVEFENDINKNKADLNYGFAVITDELCLPPILPPSSETGQIIELSDSKTGYFYWDRDNKVSWQNRDLGYRTKVIRVNEGEKYRLKCTLNGGVPVYVLSNTDYTTLPGLNSAIQVFPKRQLSGNETFDVVVTIPKFVEFLSFGYIANQEAKMIKFKTPSEPTLKTRVLNCEDDIVEANKRIDETNKRIDGLNPGETPVEPPKIANDTVKYYLNNVVCVGDSLTAGYYHDGSKYLVAKENYPFYLKKILNCKIVDNYSESGYTSKDWYQKFSSKIQWANYDSVIIWLGTNGGLSDTIEEDTANGFADTYTGHYCHIIDDAIKANSNIRIFLGTVFAVGGGSVSDKAGTNAVINKIATKYSSNVLGVVDNDNGELYLGEKQNLYHPFYKFNGDMLHFGKVGNLHLAKHYVDEICKIIEKDESKMEVLFNELN